MSRKSLRRVLLFAPVLLAVACSSPTNIPYPQPDPPPKPRSDPPNTGVMQPLVHDTLIVQGS